MSKVGRVLDLVRAAESLTLSHEKLLNHEGCLDSVLRISGSSFPLASVNCN